MDFTEEVLIRKAMRSTFDQFLFTACFHLIFSSWESTLRLILREIDPIRYKGMQNNFDSIYSTLFEKLIRDKIRKKRYLKLMGILKLIRNTIHNNGIYSPIPKRNRPPPRNKQITWRGITCKFIVDRRVKVEDFWELVFRTTSDILSIMEEIVSSSVRHAKIKKLINDPSVDKTLIPVFFPKK